MHFRMASLEDPTITLEMERYNLGQKVVAAKQGPFLTSPLGANFDPQG
jgi:hypothetical protein